MAKHDEPVVTIRDVRGCSRCGGDHGDRDAYKLTRPMAPASCAPLEFTHWFMCPALHEPVLIAITDDDGSSKPSKSAEPEKHAHDVLTPDDRSSP